MLELSNPVYASRLRKLFNRQCPLSVGDLVTDTKGRIGEYRGISTYRDPSRVTVIAYNIDGKGSGVAKPLPARIFFEKEVLVLMNLTDRPPVPERSYTLY